MKFLNMDCMNGMAQLSDKIIDLAIVDPSYFSGPERRGYYGKKVSPIRVQQHYIKAKKWKAPEKEYFTDQLCSA